MTGLAVVRERVELKADGEALIGDLHRPAGSAGGPAVVVAGPMTSVKEQVTGVYAAALARRGVLALALDHRHFGESGGLPRQYERHDRKIADLKAGLAFRRGRSDVDRGRVGLCGVCLGSGYAAWAAAGDEDLAAFGAVAGYYRDPNEMRRSDPTGFDAKVEQGRRARMRYEADGTVEVIPAAAALGDAAMSTSDTVDYYTRRAAVPTYVNEFAVMSREYFLPFDVQAAAPRLVAPVLMIHSDRALAPSWAHRFYDNVPGRKSLV